MSKNRQRSGTGVSPVCFIEGETQTHRRDACATMQPRFTIDGSNALENHLDKICKRVSGGVRAIVSEKNLEALLLGGGYGRGEGGVLKTSAGEEPYNDLEFYVLLRGNCRANEKRFLPKLHEFAENLFPEAGVEIEFKILSLKKLEQSPPTMTFYDLVVGHRLLFGPKNLFRYCAHHESAADIPLAEATRLLFNRCSGLLFARERLQRANFTPDDADFVARNQAKARLAFGDVVLTVHQLYDSSCRERAERLQKFTPLENLPWLEQVRQQHSLGVGFKLHPQKLNCPKNFFFSEQTLLSQLGLQLWLWLEVKRLRHVFNSAWEYGTSRLNKCPEQDPRRNLLINLRTFGPAALADPKMFRYPRERLFNSLALLLWEFGSLPDALLVPTLKEELQTAAENFPELIQAYTKLWRRFN